MVCSFDNNDYFNIRWPCSESVVTVGGEKNNHFSQGRSTFHIYFCQNTILIGSERYKEGPCLSN